jgi:cytochrome b pre-mRNA-processing protein 3
VRLENEGEAGNATSVALTERFIEVMESEHRELGLGDPALGKTVRKLVGSLARRTELWRKATSGAEDWEAAARESLYKDAVAAEAIRHAAGALKQLWIGLEGVRTAEIERGQLQ